MMGVGCLMLSADVRSGTSVQPRSFIAFLRSFNSFQCQFPGISNASVDLCNESCCPRFDCFSPSNHYGRVTLQLRHRLFRHRWTDPGLWVVPAWHCYGRKVGPPIKWMLG